MKKFVCKKCNCSEFKKEIKTLNSDNVVHIYTCQDCGTQETEVINILDPLK